MTQKTCDRCKQEKYFVEFYSHTHGNYNSICKECENHNKSNSVLYESETCNMAIRQKNKKNHEESYRNQKNRFWNS